MTTNNLQFAEDEKEISPKIKKERLRAYMKEKRGLIDNRDAKERLCIERFFAWLSLQTAGAGMRRNFFVYLSFSSEMPTDELIERLKKTGQGVYCPRVEQGEMLAAAYDGEDFALSTLGIREPTGARFLGEMDYAIIPLLAADERGSRLGYGGGYYDRYLKDKPSVKRVGIAFDNQILKTLPTEPWDEPLDVLITDLRTLTFVR